MEHPIKELGLCNCRRCVAEVLRDFLRARPQYRGAVTKRRHNGRPQWGMSGTGWCALADWLLSSHAISQHRHEAFVTEFVSEQRWLDAEFAMSGQRGEFVAAIRGILNRRSEHHEDVAAAG